MPGIRVAIRDDARADDVAWVVRSIDELYRIMLWFERDNVQGGSPRLVLRRNATWRSIQPLRLDEVSSGSSLFDFVTPELVGAVLASQVILKLISILERALFERGQRLAMNEIQRATAREDLTAKRFENIQAASLLPRGVAQEQPEQQVQGDGQLLMSGETEMLDLPVENASSESIEERLERIANRTTLGPEVLPLIMRSPLQPEEASPQTLAALDDATKALARLENKQTKRKVVLYVEYLE